MGWYDRKVRRVRDLSCGDTRVFLDVEVRRVDCRRCGKVKRERLDFLADNPLYTKRFAYYAGPPAALHQGSEIHTAVAQGEPHAGRQEGVENVVGREQAAQHGLCTQGELRPIVEL